MSASLPQPAKDLLDAPEFATVSTLEPDGSVQLSVVWIGRDGDDLLFSTAAGRRKPRNIERDPRVSVLVYPQSNPYAYLEVRGTATVEPDPGKDYIEVMSQKYLGKPYPWHAEDEVRVVVRVTPDKVTWHG